MKHVLPAAALLAIFAVACDDDPTTPPPGPTTETRVIRDVDYIKDTFFLVDDPASFLGAFPSSVEVFMTVQPKDLAIDPTIHRFPAWAITDSTAEGELIDAAVAEIAGGDHPSYALQQEVRRLERDTDYSLLMTEDSVVVGIELKSPVPATELRTLAVRYRNQLDHVIGGGLGTSPDTLVLEMIKAPDPRPDGPLRTAWRLAMRNAYYLGFESIDPATLSVVIRDVITTRDDTTRPEGSDVPYLRIFGLDRRGASGSGPPDGKIDNFFLNWSQDLEQRGILWMPASHAFAPPPDRVQVWTGGEFEFSGVYLPQYETSQEIYDRLLNLVDEQEVHQYIIEATVTTPAP